MLLRRFIGTTLTVTLAETQRYTATATETLLYDATVSEGAAHV